MTNLVNIQPGDLVADNTSVRTWGNAPAIKHVLYRVTKRTPTQAEAVNVHNERLTIRVRVSDGKILGQDHRKVVFATPEIVAQHNAEVAARNRWNETANRLRDLDGSSRIRLGLTVEQMEVLADAWERVKAMGKGGAA